MSQSKNVDTQQESRFAAYLLYGSSLFGIVELLTSSSIKGVHPPLMGVDMLVYIGLIVLAGLIHKGFGVAKIVYAIVAILWFLTLVVILPAKFGLYLSLYSAYMQICITVLAYVILYMPRSSKASD